MLGLGRCGDGDGGGLLADAPPVPGPEGGGTSEGESQVTDRHVSLDIESIKLSIDHKLAEFV